MKNFIRKTLLFLSVGTTSAILAACYGVPIDDTRYTSTRITDNENTPIEGLRVIFNQEGNTIAEGRTSPDGEANISYYGAYGETVDLTIEDVDGEENGGLFKTKTVEINGEKHIDIIMEK